MAMMPAMIWSLLSAWYPSVNHVPRPPMPITEPTDTIEMLVTATTRRLAITATVTVALLLTGCSTTPAEPDAPAGTAAGFGHVHGIVDAGDSTVLLGTHTGLYTLGEDGTVTGPVGGIDLDAMGLTATGDTLYASGHPGPSTPAELGAPNLGIIRSLDAGASWEPVAFTGEEDFHVLTVTGDGTGHDRP